MDKSGNVDKLSAKSRKPGQFVKGDPRRMQARGPAKGAPNAGRPRNEWIARLQAIASRDEVLEEVERALLAGRSDPFFKDALNYVTDHGYGKARQPLEHTGADGSPLGITLSVSLIDPPDDA